MPKSVFYRANAIIYCQGDKADTIPILKQGKVEIVYHDLQSNSEQHEAITTGEFFGVKAALGRKPYDETAVAITDCTVLHFTIQEFEELVCDNPRILIKMLQVFSTQLRRIHRQVQSLISSELVNASPETGLFAIGEYYLKEQQYAQASHVFKRYLLHWPKGIYAPQATLKVGEADSAIAKKTNTADTHTLFSKMNFDEIMTFYKEGHYNAAMKASLLMVEEGRDSNSISNAEFLIGCCLYQMKHYVDAAKKLTTFIHKYPEHPSLGEALWHMGLIHETMGNKDKAINFFRKAQVLIVDSSPLHRKVLDKLRYLEDKKLNGA